MAMQKELYKVTVGLTAGPRYNIESKNIVALNAVDATRKYKKKKSEFFQSVELIAKIDIH